MAANSIAEAVEVLRGAIRDQHGLESTHVESVTLRAQNPTFELTASGMEIHEGAIREGIVHVFRVVGHPHAEFAYAWSYKADGGDIRHIAVLGVPPIDSAQRAYQAAVLSELRKDLTETETDPDLLAVFRDEYAAWTAKSYDELREALIDVIAGETCCRNYLRGLDDLYQVEVNLMKNGPDYLCVSVAVCAPHDAVNRSFTRHANGRLETSLGSRRDVS